jgi:hypothetical protein
MEPFLLPLCITPHPSQSHQQRTGIEQRSGEHLTGANSGMRHERQRSVITSVATARRPGPRTDGRVWGVPRAKYRGEAEGPPAAIMGRWVLLQKSWGCLGGGIPQRQRKPKQARSCCSSVGIRVQTTREVKDLTFRLPVKAGGAAAMTRGRRTLAGGGGGGKGREMRGRGEQSTALLSPFFV